jgi:hypothetical protein
VLDANNHQGKFGEDYVRVLASAAGLIVQRPDLDHIGVDFTLRWPGRLGVAAFPGIDVQVKSWSNPHKSGGSYRYNRLNELQFNQLAGPDSNGSFSRYLFLIIVPPKPNQYTDVGPDGLLLRYQGFYTSLRDQSPIPEPSGRRHRTVQVPVANVLTVHTLQALLGRPR